MTNGKPTLADIAQHAGVSPTTASRVVHENGYVSEANRKAVMSSITALGYRPNLQARSLRNQNSRTIGLVYSDQDNPVFTKLSHAIRTAAFAANYSMLAVDHDYSAEEEKVGIEQFLDHRVSAVIMCHAFSAKNYAPLIKMGVPMIQIERSVVPKTHFVGFNTTPGLSQTLDELLNAGHRRIAFIGGSNAHLKGILEPSAIIEEERAEVFAQLARTKGLSNADCPVLLGAYVRRGQDGRLPGYHLAEELFGGAVKVTAVVSGSDMLAAGILQSCYERNIRVPEQLSLVGYDDTIAEMFSPPLASIQQPFEEIASAVFDILAKLKPSGPILRKDVDTKLVFRPSIGRR